MTQSFIVSSQPWKTTTLQAYLQKPEEWEEWDKHFHPSKCGVLIVSHKLTTNNYQYKLHNPVLENVSSTKYLGVTLQHNTKSDQHIYAVVAKTNRTLGFLRSNLRIGTSNIKAQAYKPLVCPILEYSGGVWDPAAQN